MVSLMIALCALEFFVLAAVFAYSFAKGLASVALEMYAVSMELDAYMTAHRRRGIALKVAHGARVCRDQLKRFSYVMTRVQYTVSLALFLFAASFGIYELFFDHRDLESLETMVYGFLILCFADIIYLAVKWISVVQDMRGALDKLKDDGTVKLIRQL